MCGSGPSAPAPPPRAPEAARTPEVASAPSTRGGGDAARRRRAGGVGSGTILTSASGVQDGGAATATKTLLGQ